MTIHKIYLHRIISDTDLDTLKGLTIFTFKGKPIKFDRQQVAMFIRSIAKHMGIR